jgi:hypothetical protein
MPHLLSVEKVFGNKQGKLKKAKANSHNVAFGLLILTNLFYSSEKIN